MTRVAIPSGRAGLPPQIREALSHAAAAWRDTPDRPQPATDVLQHWDELIANWASNPDLPLLVRRSGGAKGSEQAHTTGRVVVCTDNAPAHWCFASALLGIKPTVSEAFEALVSGELPIAFVALSKSERECAPRYTGTMRRSRLGGALNAAVWKVCHVRPVGIRKRGAIVDLPINALEAHFRDLMSPSNIFLVPNAHSGFGELPEVQAAFSARS